MDNKEFFQAIEALEREKGIPKTYMLERVETALLMAYKRNTTEEDRAVVLLDEEKQTIRLMRRRTVVEQVENANEEISLEDAHKISKKYSLGDFVDTEINTKDFGRIATGAAKQVIIQGIREAERGMLVREYETRQREVMTATVLRIDPRSGNATVELDRTEAVLIKSEQIPGEELEVGQKLKVYVSEVKKDSKGGHFVMISRTHPEMVKRLLELEVPEIRDGSVLIQGLVREAGNRSKVAVSTNDDSIDPVGTCIGPRSSRVNAIIQELAGEKIDVVRYSDNLCEYVTAALAPATVLQVEQVDMRSFCVTVPEDQLSLAIGREGQNARLAARLISGKVDIKAAARV